MKSKIVAWEFQSNNSESRYIAKLECGHERRDLSNVYPRPHEAVCWTCKEETK